MNFLGGIPDLPFTSIPDSMLGKNPASRDAYQRELEFYAQMQQSGQGSSFLTLPETAPDSSVIGTGKFQDGLTELISYPSRYEPANHLLRDKFMSRRANLTGYLHLWRHDPKATRKLALCIHGFMMGDPRRAEQMFRVRRLFELGLDIALYIMPHHWRRQDRPRRQYILNPAYLGLSVESFAQNMHDLHSAVLLLGQQGYERIGILGASLGGYTAALYATLPAAVDFIFMVVPAIDFNQYLKPRPSCFSFPVTEELAHLTRQALDLISPLKRSPIFDVRRICIVAHAGDRLCPVHLTRELVKTWSLPNFAEVRGGHWLYFDRHLRGQTWYDWLGEMGYV